MVSEVLQPLPSLHVDQKLRGGALPYHITIMVLPFGPVPSFPHSDPTAAAGKHWGLLQTSLIKLPLVRRSQYGAIVKAPLKI